MVYSNDEFPTPNPSPRRGISFLRGFVSRCYRNARLTLALPGSLRASIADAQPSEKSLPLPGGRGQGGFILLMVVVAIGVVALLVTGLANLTHTEFRIRHYEQRSLSAQMAAESGLEDAMHTLITQPTWNVGFTNKAFPAGGTDTYSVSVTNLFPYITLTATGKSENATRKIVAKICLTGNNVPYTIRIDKWEEL